MGVLLILYPSAMRLAIMALFRYFERKQSIIYILIQLSSNTKFYFVAQSRWNGDICAMLSRHLHLLLSFLPLMMFLLLVT